MARHATSRRHATSPGPPPPLRQDDPPGHRARHEPSRRHRSLAPPAPTPRPIPFARPRPCDDHHGHPQHLRHYKPLPQSEHTLSLPSSHRLSSPPRLARLATGDLQLQDHRRSPSLKLAGEGGRPRKRHCYQEMALPHNTKFYRLGNGGNMRFEQDLDALSEYLGRPHPEFLGTQMDHQPGRELQHDSIGGPRALSPHPELKYHVEHLDTMLHDTQKELDNYRVYANQIRAHLARKTDTVRILAYERKTLRKQHVKKDATIARLRAKIVSLEATIKAQEDQLNEMEEEGEDLQGGEAFMSDGDDFEEDENTDLEGYEFLEAGEDDHIPIEVDDE
ncbi:hypothetical protein QYE76_029093 [Lolium multiflorum]|uniref:Uncharacterized protein n=1 Tax=Lolium multiflorum TaxID=4521 RepID=A0AAD8VHW0_LOLMU|nr:hypothetical protein QYE76_029093 [Lolium multiflorum]